MPVLSRAAGLLATSIVCAVAFAQDRSELPAPVDWSRDQDHQNMLEQLGNTNRMIGSVASRILPMAPS